MTVKHTAIMCFSSGNGGMEMDSIKLAKLLSKDINIALLCKDGSYIHKQCWKGGPEFACEPVRFTSRTFSPSMLFKVRNIIRKYNIRNVIFFGASELKTLYFSFLGFDLNVIVRHGTTKRSTKRGPIHQLVYSCVNYHVALSRHLLNNVKNIVPVGKHVDYRIITSSYDHNHIADNRELSRNSELLRIIHVGRIAPGKGQIEAVTSCAELDKKGLNFRLDLIGSLENKEYSNQLKSVVNKYALNQKVNMPGHLDDVVEYLATADILLFPSYGEGMSNALIESLHYGLVCICFSNTVFPEFIKMGFYITLANDKDQEDLTRKLLYVVENLDDEKRKSDKNRALALKYFNMDRERDDWKELLV